MSTAIQTEPRIKSVEVTDRAIVAYLADGRSVSVPLEWSWRLSAATPEQRANWELIGDGLGVHWPDIDEDISVEGILRGRPAGWPSRMEIKVLLDASSLIDLERGRTVSWDDFETALRQHHARLVLTRTNVLQFAAGGLKSGDFLELRSTLQQIERLPHSYLGEGRVLFGELKEAVTAFTEHREFAAINPFVKRWDETLVVDGPSRLAEFVNQRLDDLVYLLWRTGSLSLNEKKWFEPIEKQFEEDRKLPEADRKSWRKHFPKSVGWHLRMFSIPFPPDKVEELADWIYDNPVRCPGIRFAYDWRQELMSNVTEKISENDIPDRTYVLSIPYVDAITTDANNAALCRSVSRRLSKQNSSVQYESRIFASLKGLLSAKFNLAQFA
jgi:Protein of unknown function (DUF2442)